VYYRDAKQDPVSIRSAFGSERKRDPTTKGLMRKPTLITATTTRNAVRAAVVAFGLTLAACGSSSSGTASTTTSAPAPATTSTAAATPTTSTTATTGGTTAPGTNLTPGTSAIVNYKPGVNANSPTYRLQVTAVSIEKAPAADLNGVELEKSQQGKTPYYVKLRVRNEGAGNASAEDGVPTAGFEAVDDRGQAGQELTILGNFRPCESGTQPKSFTQGVTYNTCAIYLVGGGGSIVKVQWIGSADQYTEKPIVWKAG
jgi:hypothetical protein